MVIMMLKVSGFLVARLPNMNYDPQGRGAYLSFPPCVNETCYGGIDRMQWFDIDEEFYSYNLPVNINQKRQLILDQNTDFSGINLCQDLYMAVDLLNYSNRLKAINELLVIQSSKLNQIKGDIELDDSLVTWLGFDVIAIGYFSLLREGLFAKPFYFKGWHKQLNDYGLFSSEKIGYEYKKEYEIIAQSNFVETIPSYNLYGIDCVRIGRVLV